MNWLREDMVRGFEHVERHISALGARWGITAESAFRESLRGLLEKELGYKVNKWTVFLLARSKVSEQNLILPISLMQLYSGRPLKTRLWAVLLAYSALNYSIPQLLYPIWPNVTVDLYNLTMEFEGARIAIRFVSSVIFYALYVFELKEIRNGGNRRER